MLDKNDAAASELLDRICVAPVCDGTNVGVIGDMVASYMLEITEDDAAQIVAYDLCNLRDPRLGLDPAAIRQALLVAAS